MELSADNRRMLYVPAGFAHGFQTLTDDSEVFYQISESYSPEHVRGVRWNDEIRDRFTVQTQRCPIRIEVTQTTSSGFRSLPSFNETRQPTESVLIQSYSEN